jgi:hypothetical protein
MYGGGYGLSPGGVAATRPGNTGDNASNSSVRADVILFT